MEVSAMHRRFLPLTLVLALWAGSTPALAAYPDKPIRLIVPSAAGGAPDVLMRALATQLSQQMGVAVVIDNKPGGSYLIGTMDLVHSPPDGYTLAYGNVVSLATNRSLIANVPYDVDKDLTLISNALRVSNLLVVNNDLPVRSVAELIAYAKKNPGKLAFASDGNGTTAHLGGELFKFMTGTDMLHVPYKAATAAVTDLIGGSVQLMIVNTPVSGPQAQAGRVRAQSRAHGRGASRHHRAPARPRQGAQVPGDRAAPGRVGRRRRVLPEGERGGPVRGRGHQGHPRYQRSHGRCQAEPPGGAGAQRAHGRAGRSSAAGGRTRRGGAGAQGDARRLRRGRRRCASLRRCPRRGSGATRAADRIEPAAAFRGPAVLPGHGPAYARARGARRGHRQRRGGGTHDEDGHRGHRHRRRACHGWRHRELPARARLGRLQRDPGGLLCLHGSRLR